MRDRRWWVGKLGLAGVALVTASLAVRPVAADLPTLQARLPEADFRLSAIPRPPEPPRPAGWPLVEPPEGDAAESRAEAVPEVPPTFDEPIFADPRAEPGVSVQPGLPVPNYPIVLNAPVEALIDQFVARDRERFGLWIARSGRYLPMIQRLFRERGLPEELAYTAMIESGFSPRAVSRAGAKGMWQFMEPTGRRYGLTINRWVDERLDPVKATGAAARYLGDLFGLFGHWFLAQAGYNAGEARVAKAIQQARTSDFWALTQTRHLPNETKMFVPQILAATVITRAPNRYGFDVTPEPPLAYDEAEVRRPLDLDTVARLAGVTVEEVRELNPALLARITPPFGSYALRLPVGAGARFEAALRGAPPGSLPAWSVHRIVRNQSLADVARLYRVTPQRLAELNHLPPSTGRLRGISELVVPVVSRPAGPAVAPAGPSATSLARAGAPHEVVVRPGDTLSSIAARYRVRPQVLARVNGMDVDDPLLVGTRLRLTP